MPLVPLRGIPKAFDRSMKGFTGGMDGTNGGGKMDMPENGGIVSFKHLSDLAGKQREGKKILRFYEILPKTHL